MNANDVLPLLDAAAFLLGAREWLGLLVSWWWEAAVAFAFAAVVIDTLYQPGADPVEPVKAAPAEPVGSPAAVSKAEPTPAWLLRQIAHAAGLHGPSVTFFEELVRQHFPTLVSFEDARALGADRWIEAGATPTIMAGLFPNRPDLERAAELQTQRRRDQGRPSRAKRISA